MLPIPHRKFIHVSESPHRMDVLNPDAPNVMIHWLHGLCAMGIPDAVATSLADLHQENDDRVDIYAIHSSSFLPPNVAQF